MAVAVAVAAAAGCGPADEYAGGTRTPPLQVSAATLPDVTGRSLADQGDPFRFVASPGKVLLVYFGYTNCPDVCPTTLSDIRTARSQLTADQASRIELVMATVDPERDTPEVLTGYVRSFFPEARVLRPATPAQLRAAEAPFLATSSVEPHAVGDTSYAVSHSAFLYAVDAAGVVRLEWPFGTKPRALRDDLRRLLDELDRA